MKEIPLGEIIRPAKVTRAGDTSFPLLSMTMHDGLVDQESRFSKRIASADLSSYKVVNKGQLVVGFPIDEGVLDFQEAHPAAVVSPAYTTWEIIDDRQVDRRFLSLALRSPRALAYYRTKLRGSTARRRSLPSEVFLALPIPFPPLAEQRRVAVILDHADALRTKRRRVLAHLDSLAQNIFTEMFSTATRRERLKTIGVDFVSGKNVVASNADNHPRNRVIKVSAISSGTFEPSESKPMPSAYTPPAGHRIQKGDVLFGRASGSLSLLGATAVVHDDHEDLYLPDKVWRLVTSSESPVKESYILGVLRSAEARAFIRHNASGAAGVRNISKQKLLDYVAPIPSSELQHIFEERTKQVSTQRVVVARALAADDELFASLQSRAFRGEL